MFVTTYLYMYFREHHIWTLFLRGRQAKIFNTSFFIILHWFLAIKDANVRSVLKLSIGYSTGVEKNDQTSKKIYLLRILKPSHQYNLCVLWMRWGRRPHWSDYFINFCEKREYFKYNWKHWIFSLVDLSERRFRYDAP